MISRKVDFAIRAAALWTLMVTAAAAEPFVGTRTYAYRTDDNISDGLQIYSSTVDGVITHSSGDNYILDFTNPDANPLAMTRSGDWLQLQAPQTFVTDATVFEAAVVADDNGGAMLLYVHDEFDGASSDDYSISYSVWSDSAVSVTADDLAGQWELIQYGHPNLLQDGSPFSMTSTIITVTSLGGNRIETFNPTLGSTTMVISGNELLYESGVEWYDGKMLMTEDHLFMGVIGVEDDDPLDIGLEIGYLARVPEPSTLSLLGIGAFLGIGLLRRRIRATSALPAR